MGDEKFAQECFIGYMYGTYKKLGFICERTSQEQYAAAQDEESKGGEEPMQVDEDSSMMAAAADPTSAQTQKTRDLSAFNMAEFKRKLKKYTDQPQEKQKVFPRNVKILNYDQVITAAGENILYVVPDIGDSICRRFRISDH